MEFFHLTFLAQVMAHSNMKSLASCNHDISGMYVTVKSRGIPFFRFNEWIGNHIDSIVAEIKKKKALSKN